MSEVESEFLTVRQVAARLQVTERTVHRWLAAGEIRQAPLPGRTLRIPASELVRLAGGHTEGEPKPASDA